MLKLLQMKIILFLLLNFLFYLENALMSLLKNIKNILKKILLL